MATIEAKGLAKAFPAAGGGHLYALREVDFFIGDGEFVCLLGPSGCGKSTLLNIVSRLDTAYQGSVLFDGLSLRELDSREGPRVGYLFQESRLLPWRTVRGNIEFALESEGIPKTRWREVLATHLRLVGLEGFADYYPYQLSGGMQQRVAVARAFAVDPDVLLMDEPFNALDEITARRMRRELLSIWSCYRKTVLFVTHNAFEATYLADRILVMTRCPGAIYREVSVALPRPRSYDDPDLFRLTAELVRDFLAHIGEDERPATT